ncbi:MAG TPA: exosortase/archaeosortase family protein [Methylomirabilota bacterium]|nr:exosortase/archaeosortase family protein [Methylomirabilota bacterium]
MSSATVHWQERLPRVPIFLVLFTGWLLLFQFFGNSTFGYIDTPSLYAWLAYAYESSPDDQLGYLIPFLVVALLWYRKDELLEVPKQSWWPGLAVLLGAIFLHVVGFGVQQTRVSVIAFALGLYALIGIVWGRKMMAATFFPMLLFVFCVPLNTLAETITFPLRILVTKVSVGIGNGVLGIDVFRNGSQIIDGTGKALYDVAPACSGMRSLMTMAALTTIYAFISFKSWWKRGVILAAAAPLAVLGNIVRITTVIIVGELFGTKAAGTIEQKFGFITFIVALGCILLIGRLLKEESTSSPKGEGTAPRPPEATEKEALA